MELILGVTGGSGCGKSAFCEALAKEGAHVLDADAVAREVVLKGKPALSELVMAFGEEILTSCGALDRKKMAGIVFTDEQKRDRLNEITHKYIIEEIRAWLSANAKGVRVLDVPLLFESGLDALCDRTVCVLADKKTRLSRIVARDGLSEEDARKRLSAQPEGEFYIARADDVIENYEGADIVRLAKNYWLKLEKES
ncbi:MAG: dephospho-CoA kinase [Clostridia bacterium]|nr:dephospho-CoA kinase [Clostridia bacterium]